MTAVGKFNPNSVIKDYVRGLQLTSQTERHVMLEDIRASLGSEAFSAWYNEVYKLRSTGKHTEYEQAIKAKFDELQPKCLVTMDEPKTVCKVIVSKEFAKRWSSNPQDYKDHYNTNNVEIKR
jgi:hypothetical protein